MIFIVSNSIESFFRPNQQKLKNDFQSVEIVMRHNPLRTKENNQCLTFPILIFHMLYSYVVLLYQVEGVWV